MKRNLIGTHPFPVLTERKVLRKARIRTGGSLIKTLFVLFFTVLLSAGMVRDAFDGFSWLNLLLLLLLLPASGLAGGVIPNLREAPSDLREGTLTWVGDAFQLPGSIRVRKANLENGSETASLLLDERLAKGIPQGTPLRIRTRRKFLSDYEVLP